MRIAIGCILLASAAARALSADPLDELFVEWISARRTAESLVVEFRLETTDLVFGRLEETSGTFRLLQTKKGHLFASYEIAGVQPASRKDGRSSGLLNGGAVYLLAHDDKKAMRFKPGDLNLFLETYFNPFVVLLDRARAEAQYRLEILKQDDTYIYLWIKPKQVKQSWEFEEGRLTLMRKGSEDVPRGMPRRLWYRSGTREFSFDIKAWRLNPANGPKLVEFARPDDRPGWEVFEFPVQRKK